MIPDDWLDLGLYRPAQLILTEIKAMAGEGDTNQQVFEEIRRDADTRWKHTWEHS
jgi:hypothetical protein